MLQEAADQGNAAAQNYHGLGVEQDYQKAMELFQLAADQGSTLAICGAFMRSAQTLSSAR